MGKQSKWVTDQINGKCNYGFLMSKEQVGLRLGLWISKLD